MALITNGSTSWLTLATASSWIQSGGDFTVMGWATRTTNANGWDSICSSYDGTTNSWEFGMSNGATFGVYLTWSTGGVYYGGTAGTSGPVNSINTWYHCAAAYNATAKIFYCYQDGVLVSTSTAMGAAIGAGSRKLVLAHSSDNAAISFAGRTAYVRMFRRILNGEDIRRCRLARIVPNDLRSSLIADAPLENYPAGTSPYELDRGPLGLGPFTATATPTFGAGPPGVGGARYEPPLLQRWPIRAVAASTVTFPWATSDPRPVPSALRAVSY